jgi:hypothetical protein
MIHRSASSQPHLAGRGISRIRRWATGLAVAAIASLAGAPAALAGPLPPPGGAVTDPVPPPPPPSATAAAYLPLWAVVCGTTYSMQLLVASSAPLVQLVVCAPVGLLAGLILIWVLTPMRRTALGLVDILRELKSRRVSSDTS